MDNETSKDVEDFIASQNTQQKYTPTDSHITNLAEISLQTYKSCVKSTMVSLPPTSPIAYWCRLLPQIDFSVNIVRKCRQNPLLSAWATMEGEFHFNTNPISPPGSEKLMHEKPNRRNTFGFNTKKGMVHSTIFLTIPNIQSYNGINWIRKNIRHGTIQTSCHCKSLS